MFAGILFKTFWYLYKLMMKMKTVSQRQKQTSVRGYEIRCLPFYYLPVKKYVLYKFYNKYSLSLKGYKFRICNFFKVYSFLRGNHCIKNLEVEFLQNKSDLAIFKYAIWLVEIITQYANTKFIQSSLEHDHAVIGNYQILYATRQTLADFYLITPRPSDVKRH